MNWYKKAQQIQQQYTQNIESPAIDVQITGSGTNQSINIPGGKSISAKDLLNMAIKKIKPVLIQNNVRTIDTSPISNANAQGLAISHEPGKIHIDINKIFNAARGSLPPVSQLDGVQTDPDVMNSVVNKLSSYLLGELGETLLHESKHVIDYYGAFQQNKPFTTVQESPAEQFGQQGRKRYFSESIFQ